MLNPVLLLQKPWLLVDLGMNARIVGWPLVGPASARARKIAWLQVRNDDLPVGADPADLWRKRAQADRIDAEIGLMTAAEIDCYAHKSRSLADGGTLNVIVTAGLGNMESALPENPLCSDISPAALSPPPLVGTINMLVCSPFALTPKARLEALSIAASARTAAIMALGKTMPDGRLVTGTGTDCILIAAPMSGPSLSYSGLHTTIGRCISSLCFQTVVESCANRNRT